MGKLFDPKLSRLTILYFINPVVGVEFSGTPALHAKTKNLRYKKLYKSNISSKIEDSHSKLETPVLIPNTEVKLLTLLVVVADKSQTLQAVFFYFYVDLKTNFVPNCSSQKVLIKKLVSPWP